MSDRSSIHVASPDAAEVRRALGICLAGMNPPPALMFGGGDFEKWAARQFLPVLAPHAILARELSLRGESGLLAKSDAALSATLPEARLEASIRAGRELLAQRAGARHLPVMRRFAAAVESGAAAGHFATVLAMQAADFNVAVLPLLQCLFYCEWSAGQAAGAPRDFLSFFQNAGPALASLPSLIKPHADDAPVRLTAVR